MSEFRVPIHLCERHGLARAAAPVRIGIPFPRNALMRAQDVAVIDGAGRPMPCQTAALQVWPDRSVRWLLVDACARIGPNEASCLYVVPRPETAGQSPEPAFPLLLSEQGPKICVNTGAAVFSVSATGPALLSSVRIGATEILSEDGVRLRLLSGGIAGIGVITESLLIEERGPLRATLVAEGGFCAGARRLPLRYRARLSFQAGARSVQLELTVHNPQAARHVGGLWDLGDAGSVFFKDLSVCLASREPSELLQWYAEDPVRIECAREPLWTLYQDSSGGEHWDSSNHVGASGASTVAFRGYEVRIGEAGALRRSAHGWRASPGLALRSPGAWIAACTRDFWQNFPKALRREGDALSVGVFPGESAAMFELQGGEQKRHEVLLEFGLVQDTATFSQLQHPLEVHLEPSWVESSGAIAAFTQARNDTNRNYLAYVNCIIDGPNSFFAKRELIDEYGWRNFGDLYADHEAVHGSGPQPLVSHYNNQYDFIHGSAIHFLRTGDARWYGLMRDAARHTADIDIYHTQEDRPAYNGGPFWHTDHGMDAATCTHRTYSGRNANHNYGGGPSNENVYTSGLLLYYWLTGDPDAARAVMELADWVIAIDDGSRNLLGLIDAGPTGLASQTVADDYHGPGRGPGNAANALLDAYLLSGRRQYLRQAENLIERCVHPDDDVVARGFDEPEYRWSYLVFLQVLGKYLNMKRELGEIDYTYHYARASLLQYAKWMLFNEVPYKDVLHKVKQPTETWPAQDIRKCHVLHLAAQSADATLRPALHARADFFFDRCLRDLTSFETAYLTRPMVVLCVVGYVHAHFQAQTGTAEPVVGHAYSFGVPRAFITQRRRIPAELRRKRGVIAAELGRLLREKSTLLARRLGWVR